MSSKFRWVVLLVLILSIIGLGSQFVLAQESEEEYFPETGHWVREPFLTKFESTPHYLLVYGYPITEAFLDKETGVLIQYFQKARFEWHEELLPELRVQLTPLGDELYDQNAGVKLDIQTSFPACEYFPETNFNVCYTFLDFFRAEGGVAHFGYPISGFEVHGDWIVQYFQRARFEWHPEQAPGKRVELTNLGRLYFTAQGEDPALLRPVEKLRIPPQPILDIQVRSYVDSPVLPLRLEKKQNLSVIVQDQYFNPIEGAKIEITVEMPGKTPKIYSMEATDEMGVSNLEFDVSGENVGYVQIFVDVTYPPYEKTTRTSFLLW